MEVKLLIRLNPPPPPPPPLLLLPLLSGCALPCLIPCGCRGNEPCMRSRNEPLGCSSRYTAALLTSGKMSTKREGMSRGQSADAIASRSSRNARRLTPCHSDAFGGSAIR